MSTAAASKNPGAEAPQPQAPDLENSKRPRRKPDWMLAAGIVFLILLVLFAVFWPMIGYKYDEPAPGAKPFEPPFGRFLLGTDELGRDVLSRLAYGSRYSLGIGIAVQLISLFVGILVGAIGVFAPRWVSNPLLRFTDGMFAFPDILLALLIIGIWRPGWLPVIVALSVTAWPATTRLVVTQMASLKDREFVVAARAQGASTLYVVTRHILPQLWGILMAVTMVNLAGTILAESTLSFLGIGVQPPDPSWGSMINQARLDMNSHPIMLLWPSLILILAIFALNFVGDGLRAALDPKKGRAR
jgi:ABC-type dipeptide/oligopeptide/nickel transport system permease subunit